MNRVIPPQGNTHVRRSSSAAIAGCVAVGVAGTLVTLGCLLAIYLESSGLGAPRDSGMRPGYTALLIVGALAGVLVPAAACFTFLAVSRPIIVGVAAVGAGIVAVAVLGITGL
ncbi:hypothetical protein [Arthrobacter sp. H14]|uniref:hypothetical protein n=1 Tax=Arthrobacter sp. H14 TaxID=1312959 RepID=UPI0012DD7E59|nr:hypothetical protein [Arthrobacter sp. H14]